jgi:hypothetical protein
MLFLLENVVLGVITFVKILKSDPTAPATGSMTVNERPIKETPYAVAGFFVMHYGMFTLVQGVFAGFGAYWLGLSAGWIALGLPVALMVARYLYELFQVLAHRGPSRISPGQAMMQPYPRIMVMQVAAILSFAGAIGGLSGEPFAATAWLGDLAVKRLITKQGVGVG